MTMEHPRGYLLGRHGDYMHDRERQNATEKLSLFPLKVVLLPKMPLPLHIFEERYKEMVGRCLEQAQPFGVVYQRSSGIQHVGCTATIERIISRYDDGRMDILTLGTNRFRVSQFIEKESFLEGYVAPLRDDPLGNDEAVLAREAVELLVGLAELTGHSIQRDFISSLNPEEISFLVASSGIFTLEEKQSFLELTSTRARLAATIDGLNNAIATRRMVRSIKEHLNLEGEIGHMLN